MKKIILLILLTTSSLTCIAQSDLLEEAYDNNSHRQLVDFFKVWQKEIPQVTQEYIENSSDTTKEAYAIFNEIYTIPEYNNYFNMCKYWVVQNEVDIFLTDGHIDITDNRIDAYIRNDRNKRKGISREEKKRYRKEGRYSDELREWHSLNYWANNNTYAMTLENFAPPVNTGDKASVVYFDDKYYKIIRSFLLGSWENARTPEEYAQAEKDLNSRYNFINGYIYTSLDNSKSHIRKANLINAPYVYNITFDPDMEHALIYYSTGRGNIKRLALLKKTEGKWVLDKIQILSIFIPY